jgi:hypothetical protein
MSAQPVEGLALCALAGLVALMGPRRAARVWWRLLAVRERSPHPPEPQPMGRPIELIARDAQRLGLRFRYVPAGASYARIEARRRAYDEVLGEACRALRLEHLLAVLPPGPELDVERLRVEAVLDRAGFRLDAVA